MRTGRRPPGHDRVERRQPSDPGHGEVEDDQIGAPVLKMVEELLAAGGGPHQVEVRLLLQHPGQDFADEGRVVDDGDADRAHGETFR